MRQRVPILLSVTALVVSVLGVTPLGDAAADKVVTVFYAKTAGVAQKAKKADVATKAKRADVARQATKAKTSDTATKAKTADTATEATKAKTADTATEATKAKTADTATEATKAKTADEATNAKTADVADDAKKVGGMAVAPNGKLPAAAVDLTGIYTKLESDALFVKTGDRGLALAGARVSADGTAFSYFNRFGGAPTVAHTTGSGVYTITFPGLSLSIQEELIEATAVGSPGVGEFTIVSVDSLGGSVIVQAQNQVGNFVDRHFSLVAFGASGGG